MYLQEGRFSTTVGSKKHPELSRRNSKRTVPKNRHYFSLPRRDREIHIPTVNGNVVGNISPVNAESNIPIWESEQKEAEETSKLTARFVFDELPNWKQVLNEREKEREWDLVEEVEWGGGKRAAEARKRVDWFIAFN